MPRFEVQRHVADFLDRETGRIDAVIARKQRLCDLVRERRRALIDASTVPQLGGSSDRWSVLPLRKLAGPANLFTDGDWIESPYITEAGVRLIQTGNIGVGVYREQGYRYVSEATFRELRCTEVVPGDVLICRLADPVGRACLAPQMESRMITSVDVCILRAAEWVDPRFLCTGPGSLDTNLSYLNDRRPRSSNSTFSVDGASDLPP